MKKKKKQPLMKGNYFSSSAEETENIGRQIAKTLIPGTILAIQGDLGAGKTTLIKGIALQLLEVCPTIVNSPTFNYLNIYQGNPNLCHFDLYRLKGADDFLKMGFLDFFSNGNICCIEWPERIETILPEQTCWIRMQYNNQDQRYISWD